MSVRGRRNRETSQEGNKARDDNGLKYDANRGERCGFMPRTRHIRTQLTQSSARKDQGELLLNRGIQNDFWVWGLRKPPGTSSGGDRNQEFCYRDIKT